MYSWLISLLNTANLLLILVFFVFHSTEEDLKKSRVNILNLCFILVTGFQYGITVYFAHRKAGNLSENLNNGSYANATECIVSKE